MNTPSFEAATATILNALLLVNGLSLHWTPPIKQPGQVSDLSAACLSQVEYTSTAARFCRLQAMHYLSRLEFLEQQQRDHEWEALRSVTVALIQKADDYLIRTAQTPAHDPQQLRSKLTLLQCSLTEQWDEMSQLWPRVALSLMADVEHWIRNNDQIDRNHPGRNNRGHEIERIVKRCQRGIRKHLRLIRHHSTGENRRPEVNDRHLLKSRMIIDELRTAVEGLSQFASMTYETAQRKAELFEALSQPGLAAYDTSRAELAKSYCDDLWWLLLQNLGTSAVERTLAQSPTPRGFKVEANPEEPRDRV